MAGVSGSRGDLTVSAGSDSSRSGRHRDPLVALIVLGTLALLAGLADASDYER